MQPTSIPTTLQTYSLNHLWEGSFGGRGDTYAPWTTIMHSCSNSEKQLELVGSTDVAVTKDDSKIWQPSKHDLAENLGAQQGHTTLIPTFLPNLKTLAPFPFKTMLGGRRGGRWCMRHTRQRRSISEGEGASHNANMSHN